MNNYEEILNKLAKSKFRSSFKLKQNDIKYIYEKGLDTIEQHTVDFINKRLASKIISNDGKQTPFKGHPTFIAQHATATCCRGCLMKWHHISKNKELNDYEKEYIKNIIMYYIKKELINVNNEKIIRKKYKN